MEELSKKLADHDQASKVQQQKLKVGYGGGWGILHQAQSGNGGREGALEALKGVAEEGLAALDLPVA